MNTTAITTTAHEVSDAAAYTPGMTNITAATLAAESLRQSTAAANYDATHERVNEVARRIAEQTLAETGGRTTYSWEGNGILLSYSGDTVDNQGDFEYGPTVRKYLVDGVYKTTAPVPSQSGTGLLNLSLDHVRDCTDPVVEAKRQIVWLLLDPSLDLVEYTIRTTTMWQGLMQSSNKLRTALAIRLAEVVEQKVLENPGGGLDLKDLVEGTNVVGYMVKTLDGSIFNLMKRIIQNESKHRTVLDTPVEDDDAYRRPVAELATEQLPPSAEAAAINGEADARAIAIMEALHSDDEAVAVAKAANLEAEEAGEKKLHSIRARRAQEKAAIVSRAFLSQTNLPTPHIPASDVRARFLQEILAENAAYDAAVATAKDEAAKLSAETGDKVAPTPVIREESIVYRSLRAWYNRLQNDVDARDASVPTEWLYLWTPFTADLAEQLLTAIAGHEERLSKVIEGLLAIPEPMSPVTKRRIREAMKRTVNHEEVNLLISAAIDKYDAYIQGGDFYEWELSAFTVLEHEHAPDMRTVAELGAAFDAAVAVLIH